MAGEGAATREAAGAAVSEGEALEVSEGAAQVAAAQAVAGKMRGRNGS